MLPIHQRLSISKKKRCLCIKKFWGPFGPGPLPRIRHCYYVQNKGRNIVTYSHKDLTKKHEICEFCNFRYNCKIRRAALKRIKIWLNCPKAMTKNREYCKFCSFRKAITKNRSFCKFR